MENNTHILDIDIKQQNYIDEPVVRQNDDVTFVVNVMDDDEPFDLSSVSTVTLSAERSDGNKVISIGSITELNQVTFKLPRSSVAIAGNSKATIQMYGLDNRVSTFTFPFKVEKDPSGDDWTPDDGEKTLIEIVLGEGPAILADAQRATDEADTQASRAETATENAEQATLAADTATTNALQAKDDAVIATTGALDAKGQALDAAAYATQEANDARAQKELVEQILQDGPVVSVNGKTGLVVGLAEQEELNEVKVQLEERAPKIKTNSWIDVKADFGAVGDGSNDDTTAIQSALDIANSTGQVSIVIPSGTYKVTKKLIIYGNTFLSMHPNTILLRAHDESLLQNGENQAVYNGYEGNGNIVIDGGTLDGNLVDYDFECSGINLSHAENITIRNLTIKDIYAGHAIDLSGVRNVLIDNCKFIGYRDTPDLSRSFSEAIQIDIQTPGGFPAFGAHDGTVTKDVTIRNCYFGPSQTENTNSWGVAIGHHGAVHDIYPNNINITNNIFESCSYRALRFFKFKNVIVYGNIFKNCFSAIQIATPSENSNNTVGIDGNQMVTPQAGDTVFIRDNIIEGTHGDVAAISLGGVSGALTSNVQINGNTFKNLSNSAIYSSYGKSIRIAGNIFLDGTRSLHAEYSDDIYFSSNEIGTVSNEAILIQNSTNIQVLNNKIKETGRFALNISAVNKGVIKGNIIMDSSTESSGARSAIFLSSGSSNLFLSENNVSLSDNSYGIQVTVACTGIQLTNNNVKGLTGAISLQPESGFDGIVISNTTGALRRMTVDVDGKLITTAL